MSGFLRSAATAFVVFMAGATSDALADPPGRVGRLSLIEGDVTFHDTAARESSPATLNWPVTSAAAISTAPGGRAEVRIGSTAVHLDGATALEFVRVDDESVRLRLEYGAVAVRVRSREVADELVLETRDARVSFNGAGRYRVEAGRAPDTTAVTAFQGSAQVDADGVVVAVSPGRRAEVAAGGSARVVNAVADSFDDWTLARDQRDDAGQSTRYVSPETTGYESLDEHGDWREMPDYGPVWYPRSVPAGWAPYRAGRWAWVEPWGWTWIDEAPWGFAPFHYGRWALIGGFWGWVPGAVVARPVYAPALVGWVGRPAWNVSIAIGRVPAVGWFPLAPREAFVPAYRCSTVYVRNVNRAHVANVNVSVPPRFAHRQVERAVTVVPASVVSGGQPVGRSAMHSRHADVGANAAASSAQPADSVRPPRQFGIPRRDDDGRWTRRPQPVPPAAAPAASAAAPPRPEVPTPAQPGGSATTVPRPAPAQSAPAAAAPAPPVAIAPERRRDDSDRRPERRVEREGSAPPQAPPAVAAPPQPRVAAPQAPPQPRVAPPQAPPAVAVPPQPRSPAASAPAVAAPPSPASRRRKRRPRLPPRPSPASRRRKRRLRLPHRPNPVSPRRKRRPRLPRRPNPASPRRKCSRRCRRPPRVSRHRSRPRLPKCARRQSPRRRKRSPRPDSRVIAVSRARRGRAIGAAADRSAGDHILAPDHLGKPNDALSRAPCRGAAHRAPLQLIPSPPDRFAGVRRARGDARTA